MATKRIEYIPMEDMLLDLPEGCPRPWRVEALNTDNGDVYIAIFDGPEAQERAIEYAKFKNGTLSLEKGATSSRSEKPPTQITVKIQDGSEKTLYLSGLVWTYDAKRKHITARQKSSIESVKGVKLTSLGAD